MEFLNSFFLFFVDKTKRLSHKAMIVLIVLILLVIIDNTLSFSYYYNNHSKIEQINNLNKIVNNPSLTANEKDKLIVLRKEIIARKTWKDKTWDFFSEMEFNKVEDKKIIENEKPVLKNVQRSYVLHFISSSWFILFVMISFIYAGFVNKGSGIGLVLVVLFIMESVLYGMAWVFAKVMSYIPIIFNNPTCNYILNAVLCFLVFFIFHLLNGKKLRL